MGENAELDGELHESIPLSYTLSLQPLSLSASLTLSLSLCRSYSLFVSASSLPLPRLYPLLTRALSVALSVTVSSALIIPPSPSFLSLLSPYLFLLIPPPPSLFLSGLSEGSVKETECSPMVLVIGSSPSPVKQFTVAARPVTLQHHDISKIRHSQILWNQKKASSKSLNNSMKLQSPHSTIIATQTDSTTHIHTKHYSLLSTKIFPIPTFPTRTFPTSHPCNMCQCV